MIGVALILFAVAAVGGLILMAKHLRGTNPPVAVALVHGGVAAVGLVVLIAGAISTGGHSLTTPIVLFVVAALGGFALFARHLRGKQLPKVGILIHAVVAVVAFLLLLAAFLKG